MYAGAGMEVGTWSLIWGVGVRLPQVLKPGIYTARWYHHFFLRQALSLSSGRSPGARKENSCQGKARVDDKPFVCKLRLHHQPVQTKQLWTSVVLCVGRERQARWWTKTIRSKYWPLRCFANGFEIRGRRCCRGAEFQFSWCSSSKPLFRHYSSLSSNSPLATWGVDIGSAASTSPGNLLEMWNLRPHPRPPESAPACGWSVCRKLKLVTETFATGWVCFF